MISQFPWGKEKNDIKIISDLKKDKVRTVTRADKGYTIVIIDTYENDQW